MALAAATLTACAATTAGVPVWTPAAAASALEKAAATSPISMRVIKLHESLPPRSSVTPGRNAFGNKGFPGHWSCLHHSAFGQPVALNIAIGSR